MSRSGHSYPRAVSHLAAYRGPTIAVPSRQSTIAKSFQEPQAKLSTSERREWVRKSRFDLRRALKFGCEFPTNRKVRDSRRRFLLANTKIHHPCYPILTMLVGKLRVRRFPSPFAWLFAPSLASLPWRRRHRPRTHTATVTVLLPSRAAKAKPRPEQPRWIAIGKRGTREFALSTAYANSPRTVKCAISRWRLIRRIRNGLESRRTPNGVRTLEQNDESA